MRDQIDRTTKKRSLPEHKKEQPRIVVVGSLHMDLTVKAKNMPRIGETVLGEEFKMSPGGKGANQAAAAARLGAIVTMIGRVGMDPFGERLIENAKLQNIDTEHITHDKEAHTGLALIIVDQKGNNIIAVTPGADSKCSIEDVDRADITICSSDALLAQLETPVHVVAYAIEKAFQHGVKTILNPAPASELPVRLLKKVYILTPNEREAETLSGIHVTNLDSARKAAAKILKTGTKNVVLTMGKEGALIATSQGMLHVKSPKVTPVDTTGAGDAFCGALAVAVSSGKKLRQAVSYANHAGALATMRIGAQESLPTREELEDFIRRT